MVFGLAAAAAIPCAAFWLELGMISDIDEVFMRVGLKTTVLAMCWFIGPGSLFLLWLGRTYGTVGRFNCLSLCGSLGFFLPLLIALLFLAGRSQLPDTDETLSRILSAAFSGILYGPLGVGGGWMLWRIAFRPASVPLKELADVF
jgi:hypothetical protein